MSQVVNEGESRLDLNLNSTPLTDWLAQQRKSGTLDSVALRRSLLARMIWQASYQRSPGLIANVEYLLGRRAWGENPRATLAGDICALRLALAAAGHHLAYGNEPERIGFYIRGRPLLDWQLEHLMVGAMAEVDPAQMAITRRLSAAQRFFQAMSLINFMIRVGADRLRQRQPTLSHLEALHKARQGKVV